MTAALGLSEAARGLLADLQDWAEISGWCFLRDLCANRDRALVLRAIAELKRGGFVRLERRGHHPKQRTVVHITEAGRRAGR